MRGQDEEEGGGRMSQQMAVRGGMVGGKGVGGGDQLQGWCAYIPAYPLCRPRVAADALVTACHNDTYIQGSEEAVLAGAARIMSRHAYQRQMTLVFCADADKAHHVASKLGAGAGP